MVCFPSMKQARVSITFTEAPASVSRRSKPLAYRLTGKRQQGDMREF
jgi:hypothetical protein